MNVVVLSGKILSTLYSLLYTFLFILNFFFFIRVRRIINSIYNKRIMEESVLTMIKAKSVNLSA